MKKKPFLRLTKKQREAVKVALDNRIFGCGIAMLAKSHSTGEQAEKYDQTFMQGMDKYHELLRALDVLGITIEGHEPDNVSA